VRRELLPPVLEAGGEVILLALLAVLAMNPPRARAEGDSAPVPPPPLGAEGAGEWARDKFLPPASPLAMLLPTAPLVLPARLGWRLDRWDGLGLGLRAGGGLCSGDKASGALRTLIGLSESGCRDSAAASSADSNASCGDRACVSASGEGEGSGPFASSKLRCESAGLGKSVRFAACARLRGESNEAESAELARMLMLGDCCTRGGERPNSSSSSTSLSMLSAARSSLPPLTLGGERGNELSSAALAF